jgi:GNAT superfamily N-acetyltransferase
MTSVLREARPAELHLLRRWASALFEQTVEREQGTEVDWAQWEARLDALYGGEILERSLAFAVEEGGSVRGLALATDSTSAFDGGPEGVLHGFFVEEGPQAQQVASGLVSQLVDQGRERGWRFLRARLMVVDELALRLFPSGMGWELAAHTVRKRLGPSTGPLRGPPSLRVRSAAPEDSAFITSLIEEALWAGLGPAERALFSRAQARAAAEVLLASVIGPGMAVLVAEDEQGRVGHATANLAVEMEFTGQLEAMLHDVFVLETHRGRGISTLLTQVVEALAYEAGRSFINGTVIGRDMAHAHALLEQLANFGWVPYERILRKSLALPP